MGLGWLMPAWSHSLFQRKQKSELLLSKGGALGKDTPKKDNGYATANTSSLDDKERTVFDKLSPAGQLEQLFTGNIKEDIKEGRSDTLKKLSVQEAKAQELFFNLQHKGAKAAVLKETINLGIALGKFVRSSKHWINHRNASGIKSEITKPPAIII